METDDCTNGGEAEVLDHRRCRYLLYCLYMYANPVQLADIAYQVTIWEDEETSRDVATQRHRTYMSLYHDHLPDLADAGFVEYDQEEDTVALGPRGADIADALERRLSREIDGLLAAEQAAFGTDDAEPLPDDLHRALAAPERRQVLSHLLTHSVATLEEATAVVAESDDGGENGDERQRVRRALHHVHLPLLDDVGLVTYDSDAETVALASMTAPVRDAIQSATRSTRLRRSDDVVSGRDREQR